MEAGAATDASTIAPRSSRATAVCVLLTVLAHLPLTAIHLGHLWNRPHFQFVFLLLGVVAWVMWSRWPSAAAYVRGVWVERLLLGGSLILLSGGAWLHSPLLGAVSGILAIGFLIIHLVGLQALNSLLGPWMLLWLAVPPPLGYDLILISRMQALTSRLASSLLDLARIDHLMSGNVLQLRERTLFVDEACSGVHSLFALFGCTAMFAVLTSRSSRRSFCLLVGSFGWAILLNLVRVTTIALAAVWWELDLSGGWRHEALGFITFLIALGLTLSTDQFLHFAGYWLSWTARKVVRHVKHRRHGHRHRYTLRGRGDISPTTVTDTTTTNRAPAPSGWSAPSPVIRTASAVVYSLLFAANVLGLTRPEAGFDLEFPLQTIQEDFLPSAHGRMQRTTFEWVDRDFSSDLGSRSAIWIYTGDSADNVRVAVDASFSSWHELTRCYRGTGWDLGRRQIVTEQGLSWVEATFTKSTGEHAFLTFSLLTGDGSPVTPAAESGSRRLLDRLQDRRTTQVQVFVEAGAPIDESIQQQVRAIFVDTMHRTMVHHQQLSVTNSAGESR